VALNTENNLNTDKLSKS